MWNLFKKNWWVCHQWIHHKSACMNIFTSLRLRYTFFTVRLVFAFKMKDFSLMKDSAHWKWRSIEVIKNRMKMSWKSAFAVASNLWGSHKYLLNICIKSSLFHSYPWLPSYTVIFFLLFKKSFQHAIVCVQTVWCRLGNDVVSKKHIKPALLHNDIFCFIVTLWKSSFWFLTPV